MSTFASEFFQYIVAFFQCYMNELKLRFPRKEVVRLVALGVIFLVLLLIGLLFVFTIIVFSIYCGVALSGWSARAVM